MLYYNVFYLYGVPGRKQPNLIKNLPIDPEVEQNVQVYEALRTKHRKDNPPDSYFTVESVIGPLKGEQPNSCPTGVCKRAGF